MARKRTSLDVLFTRKETDKPAAEGKQPAAARFQPEMEEVKQQDPVTTAEEEMKKAEIADVDIVDQDEVIPEAEPEVEAPPEPESEPEDPRKVPSPAANKTMPVQKGGLEFRALQVFYDQIEEENQAYWDYVIDFSDGSRLVGLNEILNSFAEKGWDVVNLFPSYTASLGAPGENFAMELRVILKRERY
ncbi:MAG: hypothetical protein JXA25_08310 [Anaerolineales bacterium]|nr:hypothetical protein [Anaerolineales bacterium]